MQKCNKKSLYNTIFVVILSNSKVISILLSKIYIPGVWVKSKFLRTKQSIVADILDTIEPIIFYQWIMTLALKNENPQNSNKVFSFTKIHEIKILVLDEEYFIVHCGNISSLVISLLNSLFVRLI